MYMAGIDKFNALERLKEIVNEVNNSGLAVVELHNHWPSGDH